MASLSRVAFVGLSFVVGCSEVHDPARTMADPDAAATGFDAGLAATDAGLIDADGRLLGCLEADLLRTQRLSAAPGHAERLACIGDQDCTHHDPTFRCPSRQVHLGASPRPVARAHLDAELAALRALEVELCDNIRIGCWSSGGFQNSTPLCVDRICSLRFGAAPDAGAP